MEASAKSAEVAAQVGGLVAEVAGWLEGADRSRLYTAPAEGDWSVMEILAHIANFLTYWSDAVVEVAAHPGQQFGRGPDDTDRTGYVLAHRNDDPAAMLSCLRDAGDHARAQLSSLPDGGWEITGIDRRRGEMPTSEIARRHLTKHLAVHFEEVKATYARVAPGSAPD